MRLASFVKGIYRHVLIYSHSKLTNATINVSLFNTARTIGLKSDIFAAGINV